MNLLSVLMLLTPLGPAVGNPTECVESIECGFDRTWSISASWTGWSFFRFQAIQGDTLSFYGQAEGHPWGWAAMEILDGAVCDYTRVDPTTEAPRICNWVAPATGEYTLKYFTVGRFAATFSVNMWCGNAADCDASVAVEERSWSVVKRMFR